MGCGFAWSFGGIGPYGVGGVLIDLCNENQHVNHVRKMVKQTKREERKLSHLAQSALSFENNCSKAYNGTSLLENMLMEIQLLC